MKARLSLSEQEAILSLHGVKGFVQQLGARLRSRTTLLFLPGAFFFILAGLVLVAPAVVLGVLAAILIAIGATFCVGAWWVLRFKARVEALAQDFQTRVVFQSLKSARSQQSHGSPGGNTVGNAVENTVGNEGRAQSASQPRTVEDLFNVERGEGQKKIVFH